MREHNKAHSHTNYTKLEFISMRSETNNKFLISNQIKLCTWNMAFYCCQFRRMYYPSQKKYSLFKLKIQNIRSILSTVNSFKATIANSIYILFKSHASNRNDH